MKRNTTSNNSDMMQKRKGKLFEHWHLVTVLLLLFDLIAVTGSYFLALWFRFDCRFSEIFPEYLQAWLKFAPIYAVVSVVVLWLLHLYQSIWRFASFVELERIAWASAILGVFHGVFITVLFQRMPVTYYIIGACLQFMLMMKKHSRNS